MVEIKFKKELDKADNTIVIGVSNNLTINNEDDNIVKNIKHILPCSGFKGELGQSFTYCYELDNEIKTIILIGLGQNNISSNNHYNLLGASLSDILQKHSFKAISVDFGEITSEQAANMAYGFIVKTWRFTKYKSPKTIKQFGLERLNIICSNPLSAQQEFSRLKLIAEGVLLCKDLVSEPANVLTPALFKDICLELAIKGLEVKVIDKDEMQQLGMNLVLNVAKGSSNDPYVVCLEWKGNKNSATELGIVGKGVCFDAGGISLKEPKNMHFMRYDMAGAAAVVGTMVAIAKQKLPVNIIGIIGLVENMPDGKAQRPGDVVTSMSGKTVEVIDTDAEGRLVLADCLWYGYTKYQPQIMIDLGTLTVETIACLGDEFAGIFTNDNELSNQLIDSGNESNDKIWRLPMGESFKKQIESDIADLKNIGLEGKGENAAAAEFLANFTGNTKWAHLDIAGVAWTEEDNILHAKGPTGFGVRLLEQFIYKHLKP